MAEDLLNYPEADGQSDYANSDILATTHDTDCCATAAYDHAKIISHNLEITSENKIYDQNRVFADLKIQDLQDSSWNEQQIDFEQQTDLDNGLNLDNSHLHSVGHTVGTVDSGSTRRDIPKDFLDSQDFQDLQNFQGSQSTTFLQDWIFNRQSSQDLLESIKTNVVTEVAHKIHENAIEELEKLEKLEKEDILDNEMFKSLSLRPKRSREENNNNNGLVKYAPKKKKPAKNGQVVPGSTSLTESSKTDEHSTVRSKFLVRLRKLVIFEVFGEIDFLAQKCHSKNLKNDQILAPDQMF